MYCLNKKIHKLFIELLITKVSVYMTGKKYSNSETKDQELSYQQTENKHLKAQLRPVHLKSNIERKT